MCPLCIATGTLVLTGAGSAGGLGALAARILHTRRKHRDKPVPDRTARSGTVLAKTA